ncbi:MAG: SDR family NAD(P)-dependent oxidoreductase [Deltaproteobacteria bacterium]|nr:SDR family NAD(P)-dependent oxidoreductase [Deltaproteobacteria bacterium]
MARTLQLVRATSHLALRAVIEDLLAARGSREMPLAHGQLTLAIVSRDAADARQKLQHALSSLAAGKDLVEEGVAFEPEPWGASRLAFLFPGQGSQYVGMLSGLRQAWPLLARHLAALDDSWRSLTGAYLCDLIFRSNKPAHEAELRDTRNAQPALGITSAALRASLADLGVEPSYFAGHSYGELTALWAGGSFDTESFLALSRTRGQLMAEAGSLARGAMLAVLAPAHVVQSLLDGVPGRVILANQNGPSQNVVSGDVEAIECVETRARERGLRATRLRTSAAFHSPLMAPVAKRWGEFLEDFERRGAFRAPCRGEAWSNVKAAAYASSSEVRELLFRQLTETVRFGEMVEGLYERGARIFVEVGAGQVLTSLVREILGSRPHLALPLDPRDGDPQAHLLGVLGRLASHGIPVEPARLATEPSSDKCTPVLAPPTITESTLAASPWAQEASVSQVVPTTTQRTHVHEGNQAIMARSFFDTNRQVLEAYFAQQVRMLEAAPAPELLPAVLEHNRSLLLDFLSAQELALAKLVGSEGTLRGKNECLPELPIPSATGPIALQDILPSPANAASAPSPARKSVTDVESWIRNKLASITGLPVASLNRETSFEGDLGLDSISMVEIWADLLHHFPALEGRSGDFRFQTIGEAISRIEEELSRGQAAQATRQQPHVQELSSREPAPITSQQPEGLASAQPRRDIAADVLAVLRRVVSSDAPLSPSADLEVDLGIDVFARESLVEELCQLFPWARIAGRELVHARTIGDLADLLCRLGAVSSDPPRDAPSCKPLTVGQVGPAVERFVLVERPIFPAGNLPSPEQILLVGTRGLHLQLVEEALAKTGNALSILTVDREGWSCPDGQAIPFSEWEALALALQRFGTAARTIVLAPSDPEALGELDNDSWTNAVDRSATALFVLAKALHSLGPTNLPERLAVVIRDGHVAASGALGIARVLRQEWPKTRVRNVVLDDAAGLAAGVLAPALWQGESDHDRVINGISIKERVLLSRAPEASPRSLRLDPSSPVLVLGGGDGITAEAACRLTALARCHIVAVGRTPLPSDMPFAGIDEDVQVQRRIFEEATRGASLAQLREKWREVARQRAIFRTRRRIEAAGGSFSYFAADASDPAALRTVIDAVRASHGPIRGLIHGAGITEDGLIGVKSPVAFQRVLRTKTESAFHLYRLLRDEPMEFALLFSSLSSFAGPPGQADYAAANEVLNALASQWNEQVTYPVRSLLWSVWTETGLAAGAFRGRMERLGIPGITNAEGTRLFGDEVLAGRKTEDWVLLAPRAALKSAIGSTAIELPPEMPAPVQAALGGQRT